MVGDMRVRGRPVEQNLSVSDYKFIKNFYGKHYNYILFFVRGKRYVCEKITATFTENGMSQLLKGEFWPLLD